MQNGVIIFNLGGGVGFRYSSFHLPSLLSLLLFSITAYSIFAGLRESQSPCSSWCPPKARSTCACTRAFYLFLFLSPYLTFFVVWQRLEEQNPEFFRGYHVRLRVKEQITAFNYLATQQYQALQKSNPSYFQLPATTTVPGNFSFRADGQPQPNSSSSTTNTNTTTNTTNNTTTSTASSQQPRSPQPPQPTSQTQSTQKSQPQTTKQQAQSQTQSQQKPGNVKKDEFIGMVAPCPLSRLFPPPTAVLTFSYCSRISSFTFFPRVSLSYLPLLLRIPHVTPALYPLLGFSSTSASL